MSLIKGLILAFVQGATELLPISSSGHLIITSEMLNINPTLELLTLLHLATGLAILIGYWPRLMKILKSEERWSWFAKIAISGIPAILLGILISEWVDNIFYNPIFIAFNLIFWGFVMIWAEKVSKGLKKKAEQLSLGESFMIGLGQALALIPGTSRSGITTLSGMYIGLKKEEALDFSFIIGLPLIFGAFFYELLKGDTKAILSGMDINTFAILAATFIFGYIFVEILKAIKGKEFLKWFGIYRIIFGFGLIIWWMYFGSIIA